MAHSGQCLNHSKITLLVRQASQTTKSPVTVWSVWLLALKGLSGRPLKQYLNGLGLSRFVKLLVKLFGHRSSTTCNVFTNTGLIDRLVHQQLSQIFTSQKQQVKKEAVSGKGLLTLSPVTGCKMITIQFFLTQTLILMFGMSQLHVALVKQSLCLYKTQIFSTLNQYKNLKTLFTTKQCPVQLISH